MLLHNVYFSAKGTTKACARCIREAIGLESRAYPWLRQPPTGPVDIPAGDALLLSLPVYGGWIPSLCLPWVQQLRGHDTPAVIVAVYGNRHFDNALAQMQTLLEQQGFRVIAAGAFVAEHSIFPQVAAGRPDDRDRAAMTEFGRRCGALLAGDLPVGRLSLPGEPQSPQTERKPAGIFPTGDDSCILCRACAAVCPAHAISRAQPKETDPMRCIQCGACIAVCHTGARNYHSEGWRERVPLFAEKCAEYREPLWFFPD